MEVASLIQLCVSPGARPAFSPLVLVHHPCITHTLCNFQRPAKTLYELDILNYFTPVLSSDTLLIHVNVVDCVEANQYLIHFALALYVIASVTWQSARTV